MLFLQVIGQGSLAFHTSRAYKKGTKNAQIKFTVTHKMVPHVKVLGLYARTDGELVADLIELNVQCKLKNNVRVT